MKEDVEKSLDVLYVGGIFLYPTDTVWGLGCDATNEVAVKKIYAAKQRNEQVPLLVLVNSIAMLERYVEEVPQVAYDIIESLKVEFANVNKIRVVVSKFNPPIGGVCNKAKVTIEESF